MGEGGGPGGQARFSTGTSQMKGILVVQSKGYHLQNRAARCNLVHACVTLGAPLLSSLRVQHSYGCVKAANTAKLI